MSESIIVTRQERVVTITLDRPPLNILDLPTITRLGQVLEELRDDSDLQVLVLRGAGEKAFSAGVAVQDHTADKVPTMIAEFHGAIEGLRELPAVTVGLVQGHCLGGGMELAAGCDIILATEESRFGQPEIKLGCYPPLAAALYPTLIGVARTADLLLTGRTIDCQEAERMGFVSRCVPAAEMEAALQDLLTEITGHSLAVTRLTIRAIRAARDQSFAQALRESEKLYLEELTATEDMHEGLTAFMEKRRPEWKHR